jgi:hypothetical protein
MIRLVQNSFFGGQLDFEMMGRQDYQRYAKGATKLCNFNVMKRGGLDKRRGFDRVMDLASELSQYGVSASTRFRAIPFAYKKTHGFVLLMSSAKCVVVGTNSVSQFKYYNVDGLDGIYSDADIQEIDYQQCGDIMFLAHQNHAPARIVHDSAGLGEHGFHYEALDFADTRRGIPSIISARGSRISVNTDADSENVGTDKKPIYRSPSASLKTEYYKVTAVFDGIETSPSTEFWETSDPPPKTKASSWAGTTYRMPWTESQKISLSISVASKTDSDGIVRYPQEIRIYKKTFDYFGLIGSIKLGNDYKLKTEDYTNATIGVVSTISNSDNSSNDYIVNTDTSIALPEHGKNLVGYVVGDYNSYPPGNSVLHLSWGGNISEGYVKLLLGCCSYEVVDESTVTFRYKGYQGAEGNPVLLRLHNDATCASDISTLYLPRSAGDMEYTVEKENGESADAFLTRWNNEYNSFCSQITDASSAVIPFRELSTSHMYITAVGGDAAISNVRIYEIDASQISSQTFDDTYITPDASITPLDDTEEIPMSQAGDYPASVSLSQQRLIWASSKNDPQRVWMSQIGDFYLYEAHEIMTPDDAIDFRLPVTRFGKINHICEMRKLLFFNSACEWLVDSASSVQGLTHETIQAYPQSYSGSSERLKPIICNNSLIFCERTGQTVRRFAYDISNDGFAGRDVSILSSSIFEFNSIIDWTYQQFPYSTLWCAMKDGTMASFEYMEEQDIMAWLTHKLGGNGEVVCIATSYAVSPALDEVTNADEYEYATHEEIFAVVRRQNSLWLERMRPRTKTPTNNMAPCEDTLYHSLCLDGMRVLNRLNGFTPTTETGAVWIPADTTDGATITRDEAIGKLSEGVEVYEGFPFDAVYTSVHPHIGNGIVGNGQFDIKHVHGCGLRLMHSFGGKVTPVGSNLSEPVQYFYNDPQNDHRPVFYDGEDGNKRVRLFNHDTAMMSLPGVNNRDGRVTISQDDPYPFSLLSYELDFEPETGGFR